MGRRFPRGRAFNGKPWNLAKAGIDLDDGKPRVGLDPDAAAKGIAEAGYYRFGVKIEVVEGLATKAG